MQKISENVFSCDQILEIFIPGGQFGRRQCWHQHWIQCWFNSSEPSRGTQDYWPETAFRVRQRQLSYITKTSSVCTAFQTAIPPLNHRRTHHIQYRHIPRLHVYLYPLSVLQDKIRLLQDDLESERELRARVSNPRTHIHNWQTFGEDHMMTKWDNSEYLSRIGLAMT